MIYLHTKMSISWLPCIYYRPSLNR